MNCPICDGPLTKSIYTELIYNCTTNQRTPYHYSASFRWQEDQYNIKPKELVLTQEDFQFNDYIILKTWDFFAQNPAHYFIAERCDKPAWRWYLELSPIEFNLIFPIFNPKDINFIINKLELFNTFS